MNGSIYLSELKGVSSLASQIAYRNYEIGGDIYGTFNDLGEPVIMLMTAGGENAISKNAQFTIDHDYTNAVSEYLYTHYGLQYLGDWHSHHYLGLTQPSRGDQKRIVNIFNRTNRKIMVEIIVNHQMDGNIQKENLHAYIYRRDKNNIHLNPLNLLYLEEMESPIRKVLNNQEQIVPIRLSDDQFPTKRILINNQPLVNDETSSNQDEGYDYTALFLKNTSFYTRKEGE